MNINEMLSENSFLIGLKPSSKKQLLEDLSKLAAHELNITNSKIIRGLACVFLHFGCSSGKCPNGLDEERIWGVHADVKSLARSA